MTAAVASSPKDFRAGLRPVNSRKDMPRVADLIETTFASQLDAGGRRLIRDMRTFGRAGWLGWLASKLFLPAAAAPLGYVWEEDGRIVGNASLLEVAGYPDRYVLANVAVEEEYRGRGIGRAMVESSLELARRLQTRTLLLQVDHHNKSARELYRELGFGERGTWTTWVRSSNSPPPRKVQSIMIRRRQPNDWRAQWNLARHLHPNGFHWPYPLNSRLFRPDKLARIFGRKLGRHWTAIVDDELVGSVSLFASQSGRAWRMFLLVDPRWKGKVEESLMTSAITDREAGMRSVVLDYPLDEQTQLVERLHFRSHRTLTWMAQSLGQDTRAFNE